MKKFKRVLSVLLAIVMIVGTAELGFGGILSMKASAADDGKLKADANGNFRILQIADVQDTATIDPKIRSTIRMAISSLKPDLIVLTGDNIHGATSETTYSNTAKQIADEFIDASGNKIPFVVTYGNHDYESNKNDGSNITLARQNELWVAKGATELSGYNASTCGPAGTGYVDVYDSTGTTVIKRVILLNSGTYSSSGYGRLGYNSTTSQNGAAGDNVAMYNSAVNVVNGWTDAGYQTIVFQHIPLHEFPTKAEFDGRTGTLSRASGGTFTYNSGIFAEEPGPASLSTIDLYNALAKDNVVGIFYGHDHMSTGNVTTTIGGKTLRQGYGGGLYYELDCHYDESDSKCSLYEMKNDGSCEKTVYSFTSLTAGLPLSDTLGGTNVSYPTNKNEVTYISDVAMFYSDTSFVEAVNNARKNGYTPITKYFDCGSYYGNLNGDSTGNNTRGKWICLAYKTTRNPADALRDIRLALSGNDATTKAYSKFNGTSVTYNLVSTTITGTTNNVNLGGTGYKYNMYYTKDAKLGAPITELFLLTNGYYAQQQQYPYYIAEKFVFENGKIKADLNRTNGGMDIWLCIKKYNAASGGNVYTAPADIKIAVPETIYLAPNATSATTFQYFVNNEMSNTGAVTLKAEAAQGTGKYYFRCPEAASVTVSLYNRDNTKILNNVSLTLSNGYGSGTFTSGTLSSGLTPNSSDVLKWEFTYTLKNGDIKTQVAYTTVYAPYTTPIGAAANATADRLHDCTVGQIAWVSGAHSVSAIPSTTNWHSCTEENKKPNTKTKSSTYYLSPLLDGVAKATSNTNSASWFNDNDTTVDTTFRYTKENRDPGGSYLSVMSTGYTANITVDTSRNTNLNTVPNFTVGSMVTTIADVVGVQRYAVSCYTQNTFYSGYSTDDDKEHKYLDASQGDYEYTNTDSVFASDNSLPRDILYNGTLDYSISASATSPINIAFKSFARGKNSWKIGITYNAYVATACFCPIKITPVNKSALRGLVAEIVQSPFLNGQYDSTKYTSVMTTLKDSAKILGKPNATQAEIDAAYNNLLGNQLSQEDITSRTATFIHKTTSGKELRRLVTQFKSGSTLTATPIVIPGYTVHTGYEFQKKNVQTSDCSFDILYDPISYTVAYNANGGTGTTASSTHTYDAAQALTANGFTKTGYTFAGWATSADGEVVYSDGQSVINLASTANATVTLYAKWTPNANTTYKVEHYVMGTDGKYPSSATATDNLTGTSDASLTLANLKKASLEVENGITYSYGQVGGSTVTTTTIAADGSRVIKLYYARSQYALTLNKGTGIASVSGAGTYYYGQSVSIDAAVSTGYTWSKWSDNNTTKARTYTMPAAATTLTATATANTYTVAYNGNGSTGGSTDSSSHTYDTAKNLTANGFTKTGYIFAGWATSTSGDVAYADKASVSNLTSTNGATVTLYAKWTPNANTEYKVEHYVMDTNGSYPTTATKTENKTGTTDTSLTLANLKDSTLEVENGIAYSYGQVGGSIVTATTIAADGSRVIKLYYARSQYVLTLDKGTGIDSVSGAGTYYYGQSVSIDATVSTGYTWSKWSDNNTTKARTYTMPAAATTLTATATANTYTVAYNGNGSTGGSTANSSHTYDVAKNLTANGFTRAYTVTYNYNYTDAPANGSATATYTFAGWATTETGTKAYDNEQSVTNLTSVNGATVTLYATWTSASVTLSTPTRTGYIFAGWNTNADGTGTAYTANSAYTPSANVTLYAQWTKIANDDVFVIDSGAPVKLNVLGNDLSGAALKANGITVPANAKITAAIDGTMIKVTPTGILDGVIIFTYTVTYSGVEYEATVKIIPATTVYYEESFVTFVTKDDTKYTWTDATASTSEIVADAAEAHAPGYYAEGNRTYSSNDIYDSTNSKTYSLGNAKKTVVTKGNPNTKTDPDCYAEFTFTGTGFEVNTVLSAQTGNVKYTLTKDGKQVGKAVTVSLVNGYQYGRMYYKNGGLSLDGGVALYTDGTNVVCRLHGITYYSDGKEEVYGWLSATGANVDAIYQAPAIYQRNLEYGTYTVKIVPRFSDVEDINDDDICEFYIDSVKIYNPLGAKPNDKDAEKAYQADNEYDVQYQSIRDILVYEAVVKANNLNLSDGKTVDGVALLGDTKKSTGSSTGITTDLITEYRMVGPKNEVYLENGNTIAFKVAVPDSGEIPAKLAVGAKLAYAYDSTKDDKGKITVNGNEITISTPTEKYFNINGYVKWENDEAIITIKNTSNAPISVTDIKWSYGAPNQTASLESRVLDFYFDAEVLELATQSNDTAKNVLNVELGETANTYQIKVTDRANMIQFMELDHGDGTGTRSFDRYNDNVTIVSYDKDGNRVSSTSKDLAYEVWTVETKLAEGNVGVRVKEAGSAVWEDASNAFEFENTRAALDSAVISATPAKTEGAKGSVKVAVVAGADAQVVQLKNKEGETFTFDRSKATENADGTLTFNCAVYFHGTSGTVNTAAIRVNDTYGWHDSDVTVEYTIK